MAGAVAAAAARSIPACAGEPTTPLTPAVSPWVYPRVCGGTIDGVIVCALLVGLSPRVRGNPGEVGGHQILAGSIPACAGEPEYGANGPIQKGVYPRVCGGTGLNLYRGEMPNGLSPRVRGNRALGPHGAGLLRSIPACAGEPQ